MSDDPRAELDALSHALGSLVRRRAALGQRSTARPAAAPTGAPTAARVAPERAAPARPRAPSKPPAAPSPAPTPAASKTSLRPIEAVQDPQAPIQRPSRSASQPQVSAAERALQRGTDEVAARAAACSDLEALRAEVAACKACSLCASRTQTVFGAGQAPARVLFIGEAPGYHEDQQGVPFVGPSGELLGGIITKGMGLAPEEVYIANVLKCRPPENRDPSEHEKRLCTPFLDRQIELVQPEVIIPLGRHAASHVLGMQGSMGSLRGRVHLKGGRKVVPTYHPAYVLRGSDQKAKKAEVWKDIQRAMGVLGLEPPPR